MESLKKQPGRIAMQAAVSVICLGWVIYQLRSLDWRAIQPAWTWFSPALTAACLVTVMLLYLTRLCRLRRWVSALTAVRLTYTEWLDLYLKSIALGSVTPARLGDLAKIPLLANTGMALIPRSSIVILDKLADGLYIPLGICLTAGVVGQVFDLSQVWLFALGLVMLLFFPAVFAWLGKGLPAPDLIAGIGLTLLGFGLFWASNILLFEAAGVRLPALDIAAITISAGVLASLPISIGGLGVREGSLYAFLGLWGVGPELLPPLLLLEFMVNTILPLALLAAWKVYCHYYRIGGARTDAD